MSYTGGTTSWEFRGAGFAKQLYFSPRNCSKLSSPQLQSAAEIQSSSTGVLSNTKLYSRSSAGSVNHSCEWGNVLVEQRASRCER